MVNGTNQTSTQGVVESPILSANPLDLVNKEPILSDTQIGVKHKGIIDNVIGLIAKITGNPDPFTGKGNITTTAKPEANIVTQTAAAEFKPENQTATMPVKAEESGLFGKFNSTLTNIGNVVENLGNKAVGEATNVVNKGLETAGTVGEKALGSATNIVSKGLETAEKVGEQVAKKATDNVNEFVKLEEPKKE